MKASLRHMSAIVELREYQVLPGKLNDFIHLTDSVAELRNLLPSRLFSTPDTGGRLNNLHHFYYYNGGLEERESARTAVMKNNDWTKFVNDSRQHILQQTSSIYVEAPLIRTMNLCGMQVLSPASAPDSRVIYEVRKYRLKLGYNVVPKFLEIYGNGLPSKLSAPGTDPSTELCTVLSTEVGELNNVIEIWRHGGGASAMNTSRIAARNAFEWRVAINSIAELAIDFTSAIHKPLPLSNWK